MKVKKMLLSSLSLIALSLPLVTFANGLRIVNHTNKDTTCRIANVCSSRFGSAGITNAGAENPVPESLIRTICGKNANNCVADVYMSRDCSGAKVSTVTFGISSGTKRVDNNPASPFQVMSTVGSFTFLLTGMG